MAQASEFRPSRRSSRQSISRPPISWARHIENISLSRRSSLSTHSPPTPQYKLHNLELWNTPPDLWELLPLNVQRPIASLQQTGAHVLTNFERINKLHDELGGRVLESDDDSDNILEGENPTAVARIAERISSRLASLDLGRDSTARILLLSNLPSLPHSTTSTRSTSLSRLEPESPPSSLTSMQPTLRIQRGGSIDDSSSPILASPAQDLVPTLLGGGKDQASSPATPPPSRRSESTPTSNGRRSRSFYRPPRDPRIAQWRAEVSYLRGDGMVNLRHWLRKAEGEWKVFCAQKTASATSSRCSSPFRSPSEAGCYDEENVDGCVALEEPGWLIEASALWEPWFAKIKNLVAELDKKARDLGEGEITVPGWA